VPTRFDKHGCTTGCITLNVTLLDRGHRRRSCGDFTDRENIIWGPDMQPTGSFVSGDGEPLAYGRSRPTNHMANSGANGNKHSGIIFTIQPKTRKPMHAMVNRLRSTHRPRDRLVSSTATFYKKLHYVAKTREICPIHS
jgi:hypothetical protein